MYVKLIGDQTLIKKLQVLDVNLRRSIIREALRPVARDLILPAVKQETKRFTYHTPLPKGHKRGALLEGLTVRSIRRTRTTIGVTVLSTFQKKLRSNSAYQTDLYWGAFVNWGHKIGKRPGKGKPDHRQGKVEPVPYMTAAFNRTKSAAGVKALYLLRAGIERQWNSGWTNA